MKAHPHSLRKLIGQVQATVCDCVVSLGAYEFAPLMYVNATAPDQLKPGDDATLPRTLSGKEQVHITSAGLCSLKERMTVAPSVSQERSRLPNHRKIQNPGVERLGEDQSYGRPAKTGP
jgi:hypothetical protein